MIVKVGNFAHRVGEAGVSIETQLKRMPNQVEYAHHHRWSIDIMTSTQLESASSTAALEAIDTRSAAIIAAYRSDVDLQILTPDSAATVHAIKTSDTIGGVRLITPPSFPNSKGTEMVTVRTIRAVFEATVPIKSSSLDSLIYSHTESLSYHPAGRKLGAIETINTPAVLQTLRAFQSFRASQKGRIVGLYDYVERLPLAAWPNLLVDTWPMMVKQHPEETIGSKSLRFPIDYEWTFVSSAPYSRRTNPNIWMRNVS